MFLAKYPRRKKEFEQIDSGNGYERVNIYKHAMTYKELLQQLADQAVSNYTQYLQSKIDAQINTEDQLLPETTQHFKDTAEQHEKKFNAVLATVKDQQILDESVSEEDMNDFMK